MSAVSGEVRLQAENEHEAHLIASALLGALGDADAAALDAGAPVRFLHAVADVHDAEVVVKFLAHVL